MSQLEESFYTENDEYTDFDATHTGLSWVAVSPPPWAGYLSAVFPPDGRSYVFPPASVSGHLFRFF